jgi:hypothetical protein
MRALALAAPTKRSNFVDWTRWLSAHAAAFDGPLEDQFEFLEKLGDQSNAMWRNFVEIHAAPPDNWPAPVRAGPFKSRTVRDWQWHCSNAPQSPITTAATGAKLPEARTSKPRHH